EIGSYAQLEEGMKNGTVRAGVVIPEDFATNVAMHRSTEVLTVYDASNLIWGFNIRRYTLEVVNKFSADHAATYLAGLGMTSHEINNTLNTVSCNIEVLYNPTYSYTTFMIMGLFLLIIHQLGLLCVGLTVTREKERNTWIQYLAAAVPAWKIYLGKSLPYFFASLLNYGLLIWFAVHLVHVKVEGPASLVLALGLVFILIITSVGFYLSVRAANSLQITRLLMLLSVPFFFIAGYTWPKTHIPALGNALATLLPYNWMAEAMRLVTVKNLGFAAVQLHTLFLCAMAALAMLLAATFSKRIKPPENDGPVVNGGTYTPRKMD
ncbi:MAG: ABC transporter permease, partial [Desulfotomaculaceae bacterium]|nr:ABC transporter permease [Desulfotomaculaceae bacterium]